MQGHGKLHFCTVSPGDCVLIPPAFIVAEHVNGDRHCTGLRMSFLDPVDVPGKERLKQVFLELCSDEKTKSSMTAGVLKCALAVLDQAHKTRGALDPWVVALVLLRVGFDPGGRWKIPAGSLDHTPTNFGSISVPQKSEHVSLHAGVDSGLRRRLKRRFHVEPQRGTAGERFGSDDLSVILWAKSIRTVSHDPS